MFFVNNSIPIHPNTNEYFQIPQTIPRALPLAQQQYPSPIPFTQSHILTFTAPNSTHEFMQNYQEMHQKHHEHREHVEDARDNVIKVFTTFRQEHPDASELLSHEINDSVLQDIFFDKQIGNWLCCKSEGAATVFKGFALIFVFAMYITCLLLIMEYMRSIASCEDKIIRRIDKDVSCKCENLGQYCKFDWLGQNLTIKSYLTARMISYIVSSFPFIFMIYAKQRHLKNWINGIMGRENDKLEKYEEVRGFIPSAQLIKTIGSTLDKDTLKSISMGLFVVIYVFMGILIFILDIDLALFLNGESDDAKECRKIINGGETETDFINYVDGKGEKMNIRILCILLTSLNSIYFAWSVVYTTIGFFSNARNQHVEKIIRKEKDKSARERRRNEGGAPPDANS